MGDREKTRESAGMVVMAGGGGAVFPCALTVRDHDRYPLAVRTPFPVPDGRYELLAPKWKADAVKVNGAWELSGQRSGGRQE